MTPSSSDKEHTLKRQVEPKNTILIFSRLINTRGFYLILHNHDTYRIQVHVLKMHVLALETNIRALVLQSALK